MENRYLIVADPLAQLNPVFDLGVLVSGELLRRGIAVDYLDQRRHDAGLDTGAYLAGLPVREIRSKDAERSEFWELGPEIRRPVDAYTVVLQRKDPPVDAEFKAHAEHWIRAPEAIVQINRPPATYELSEHTVALRYPEYATSTWVCSSFEELVEAVRAQDREAVCKPKNTYCGIGVTFVDPNAPEENLRSFWEAWAPEVIVQPYLPAIEDSGDLRILTINQEVLGSVLRVPAEGSRLANLHQGATAARLEPTPRQLECCRVVAEDLNPLGLHLLGLDFIGEHLNEVNFTSPTTLTQINQVNHTQGERTLIDETERMWRARR